MPQCIRLFPFRETNMLALLLDGLHQTTKRRFLFLAVPVQEEGWPEENPNQLVWVSHSRAKLQQRNLENPKSAVCQGALICHLRLDCEGARRSSSEESRALAHTIRSRLSSQNRVYLTDVLSCWDQ